MKRLGIDLRGLQTGHEFRGIGMYIRSVVEELFVQGVDKRFNVTLFYYDSSDPLELINLPEHAVYQKIVFANPKKPSSKKSKVAKAKAFIYEIFKNHYLWSPVPRSGKLNIFLQFDQQLGLPKNPFVKNVLVVHDLIPLIYKRQYLPSILRAWRMHKWRGALRTAGTNYRYRAGIKQIKSANKIIAISQSTKNDLVMRLGIKENKIAIAYNGGAHSPSANPPDLKQQMHFASSETIDAIIKKAKGKPYILFIGGPEPPRRRLDHLVAAYHQLRAAGRPLQLVFVGKELANINSIPSVVTNRMIQQISYSNDLHLLGYVSDKDVNRLYEHALSFIFPSLYEGFGLPLLEAMSRGCPVIAYENSSIPEVVGNAGLLIVPGAQNIVEGVNKLQDEPQLRERIVQDGYKQAEKFSWAKSAKQTLETLTSL
jgi:glycosyltransferase involved in cell wall biosynthesis